MILNASDFPNGRFVRQVNDSGLFAVNSRFADDFARQKISGNVSARAVFVIEFSSNVRQDNLDFILLAARLKLLRRRRAHRRERRLVRYLVVCNNFGRIFLSFIRWNDMTLKSTRRCSVMMFRQYDDILDLK